MEEKTLEITDNVRRAMDYAFDEAQRLLSTNGGFMPFTVTVVDEGLELNEHSGETPDDIRESVKMLLAQDMPEGYALCYDGYVETDEGTRDAIVVEVACRGAARADILAMLYIQDADAYTFEPSYAYAGAQAQLYPAGTKPIVSGLAALEAEESAQDEDAEEAAPAATDADEADAAGQSCPSAPSADDQPDGEGTVSPA